MLPDDLIERVRTYAQANNVVFEQPFETGIGGMTVMHGPTPCDIKPAVYDPVMCLVLQGAKQVTIGGRTITFDKGDTGIVSVDLPVTSRVIEASPDEPYLALAIAIDMRLLRELAAETGIFEETGAAHSIETSEADEALVHAMGRLFDLREQPDVARAVMEPLLVKEIHFWMLSARHGAMLRALCRKDSYAERIARAITMIRRDFTARLRVEELARVAGMSASAFHDHFKTVTGTTPLQFQKQLRLMEAKRLISAGELSVSSTAYRVGYESPTQFSREYARTFGTPPRSHLPVREAAPA